MKFSNITWTKDNKGIFYGCYPDHDPKVCTNNHNKYTVSNVVNLQNATGTDTESLKNQKLYYHVLGTSQAEDVMCVEFADNPKVS